MGEQIDTGLGRGGGRQEKGRGKRGVSEEMLSIYLSIYLYIYVHIYINIYIYLSIYIYTENTEKE